MVSPQLYSPLCNPSRGFPVLDDICKWCRADYSYGGLLKVVHEFPIHHKHTKDQFLAVRIRMILRRQHLNKKKNPAVLGLFFVDFHLLNHNYNTDGMVVG